MNKVGWIVLTLVAAVGAALSLAFLIHDRAMRSEVLAKSQCPEYTAHWYKIRLVGAGFTFLTWTGAASIAHANPGFAGVLMVSPVALALVLVNHVIEWLKSHPDSESYVVGRFGDRAEHLPWIHRKGS